MKQPVNWYQLLGTAIVVIGAAWGFTLADARERAELRSEVNFIKNDNQQLKQQLNAMQLDIRQILVTLQDKQDRP